MAVNDLTMQGARILSAMALTEIYQNILVFSVRRVNNLPSMRTCWGQSILKIIIWLIPESYRKQFIYTYWLAANRQNLLIIKSNLGLVYLTGLYN